MYRAEQRLFREARTVDLIIEVRDARLPLGSGNPELARLTAGKPRLLLFNKASLADPGTSEAWAQYFKRMGEDALFTDTERAADAKRVLSAALSLTERMRAAYTQRGIRPPEARVIVLGIPNVGKSTLINRLLQRKRLATGPEPGVTRSSLWVPLRGKMLMLDTPGVLLPRIETDAHAMRLGWLGALPGHLMGAEKLAQALAGWLFGQDPELLAQAYPARRDLPGGPEGWLPEIAQRRGFLAAGALPDTARAADQLLRDFREGKLARHTLELPP